MVLEKPSCHVSIEIEKYGHICNEKYLRVETSQHKFQNHILKIYHTSGFKVTA